MYSNYSKLCKIPATDGIISRGHISQWLGWFRSDGLATNATHVITNHFEVQSEPNPCVLYKCSLWLFACSMSVEKNCMNIFSLRLHGVVHILKILCGLLVYPKQVYQFFDKKTDHQYYDESRNGQKLPIENETMNSNICFLLHFNILA